MFGAVTFSTFVLRNGFETSPTNTAIRWSFKHPSFQTSQNAVTESAMSLECLGGSFSFKHRQKERLLLQTQHYKPSESSVVTLRKSEEIIDYVSKLPIWFQAFQAHSSHPSQKRYGTTSWGDDLQASRHVAPGTVVIRALFAVERTSLKTYENLLLT